MGVELQRTGVAVRRASKRAGVNMLRKAVWCAWQIHTNTLKRCEWQVRVRCIGVQGVQGSMEVEARWRSEDVSFSA